MLNYIRSMSAMMFLLLAAAPGCGDRQYGLQRVEVPRPMATATGELWLFADSQLHNVMGASTRSKSSLAEELSSTAIRPPSLDLWAEVVLEEVSNKMRREEPEIPAFFLGDATNVSCIDEYARFLKAVGAELVWFGVPGNHDGYYMGNFTFEPRGMVGTNSWQGACAIDGVSHHDAWPIGPRLDRLERALWRVPSGEQSHVDQGVLTKAHVIWMYLAHLQRRGVISFDPLDPARWPLRENGARRELTARGTYRLGSDVRSISLVASISAATVESSYRTQPWESYLVQDVELRDRSHAILVDTSDYLNLPPSLGLLGVRAALEQWRSRPCWERGSSHSFPGSCGEISTRQIQHLGSLMAKAREAAEQRGDELRYMLLGHHPWPALRRDSVERVAKLLRDQPGLITYLSGHTHQPAATMGADARAHWEINIGSTTDWPMEYAKVAYWISAKAPPVLGVDVRRIPTPGGGSCPYRRSADPRLPAQGAEEMRYQEPADYITRGLRVYGHLLDEIATNDPAAATSHRCRIGTTQLDLLQVRQIIEARAGASSPTALYRKRRLLADLVQCDRETLRQLDGVREMEIDCAAWASRLEYDTNREGMRNALSDHAAETFSIEDVPGRRR